MTTFSAPTSEDRFSAVVRSATAADHGRAAASGFMSALFRRELPLAAYTEMVAQQAFAYAVLEQAADAVSTHPVAGVFVDDALRRSPALVADMQVLVGPDWIERHRPSEATRTFCARMEAVCTEAPERLVAHHYTRYLGDLSGGQMIGQIACQTYGLAPGAGASFYDFDAIPDVEAYKEQYRRRMDQASWSEDERDALLDEVRIAYRLNTDVVDELDRRLGAGAFG